MRLVLRVMLIGICCGGGPLAKIAADDGASASDLRQVMAHLGQRKITRGELELHRGGPLRAGPAAEAESTVVEQTALHLLALQGQALQTLRAHQLAASNEEVEAWITSHPPPQAAHLPPNATVEQLIHAVCEQYEVEEFVYRDVIAFRLSWQRYLAKYLTEQNVGRHFKNQAARFDGTRFQVQQLSIAVPAGASAERERAAERLEQFRAAVVELDTEWDKRLARDFPHQAQPLPMRWVRGTGDLDPHLIGALLATDVGGLTAVTHTATGVHLLRLLQREPGNLTVEDVSAEVRGHLLLFLLEHLAQQSQAKLPLRALP
ncbi:MAG: peptidyl-prolyl cis-trans isomerase, partial [Planctomycetales bacterium]|nr:peptidyl-prolyl cis-trans isomerase [Planctomycetales bacterium]